MGKRAGKIERKAKGSAGTLFFGIFLGFIVCLGLLAGVGCFAYFKVSPNWLNKTFKTDIDLGNEDVNDKTLSDFVSSAIGLVKNVDSYTLNDLKGDFGIEVKDELFGLNISDLKNVALTDLGSAIENKFATISAEELKTVNGMNLDSMSNILNKKNSYYYNSVDEKLYYEFDGTNYSSEVTFKYELSADKSKVIIKGSENPIVINKVEISLWNLPLTTALKDFTSNMGNQITLFELEDQYGVDLPDMFNNVDKTNTTINEMQAEIEKLYVADVLGYTLDKTDPENIVVKDGDVTVTGIVATLAKFKIENLSEEIDTIKIKDIFSTEELNSGALSLINKETELTSLATELSKIIEEKTIDEFITAGLVETPTGYTDITKLNWIEVEENTYKQVKDLLLQDIVNIFFNEVDISGLPSQKPPI